MASDCTSTKGGDLGARRALIIALCLTAGFVVVEIIAGILANSLALVADAGHMLSDAAALGLSVFALWMAQKPHTERQTFGYHRAEVLAALVNGAALLAIAGIVCWHAIERLQNAPSISSGPMLVVAIIGLVVNLAAIVVLGHHRHANLNVRGAFLHVLGDALASVGVLGAAIVIRLTGWTPIDALVSVAIAVLIVVAGWRLVKETVSVLLESTPPHLDAEQLRLAIEAVPGVKGVHDLHVWTVTSGFVSLSCHADLTAGSETDDVLRRATAMLAQKFSIEHVTIQPERSALCEEAKHCCMDEHRPIVETSRMSSSSG